ncbi:PTS sugar transporter subunit IIC [Neobacillus endophyticus]|uniref:PTS sugar transporter subunit IIC n=1 Tax=Neobacillus endophyticus TaxID=2738405 RepID=UPI001C2610E6|nr:PTS sugar transporter subunit IIC [Neobacillus endophyticus]
MLAYEADKYAEEGNTRGIEMLHLAGCFGQSLMLGLIVTISYYVGSAAIKHILDAVPQFVQNGLQVATGILPALGFAMLARLLVNKKVVPFFFLGFIVAGYLKVPVTGIAIFGAITAVVICLRFLVFG